MQQNLQQNKWLVQNVFNSVFDKYDLMNDLMSFGVHRLWKKELIYMMNPIYKQKLIDVGSGTGDVAKLYSEATNNNSEILCIDPNIKMIGNGKKKLQKYVILQCDKTQTYYAFSNQKCARLCAGRLPHQIGSDF